MKQEKLKNLPININVLNKDMVKCVRCGEYHENNETPSGESFCDDCLTMDDVFPEEVL